VYEVFPLAAGVAIALMVQQIATPQLRVIVLITVSVLFGAIASSISGELLISWAYLVFDAAQVLIVACASMVLVAAWKRRTTRMR
jgi:hypothetical protein